MEIVDGISGAVTTDKAGNDNQLKILLSAISDSSHDSRFFFFRLKRQHAMPVYLTATELYPGGPLVAVLAGATAAVT